MRVILHNVIRVENPDNIVLLKLCVIKSYVSNVAV